MKIHDKECVRLLNDIESKGEEINSLKLTDCELEAMKKESELTTNQLRSDIISIESSLQTNEVAMRSREESFAQTAKEKEELQARLHYLTIDLKEHKKNITELENNLRRHKIFLFTSNLDLVRIRYELSACKEALSLKEEMILQLASCTTTRDEFSEEVDSSCMNFLPNFSLLNEMDSSSNFSPSINNIFTKQSELLHDLVKMKSIIHDAITPIK